MFEPISNEAMVDVEKEFLQRLLPAKLKLSKFNAELLMGALKNKNQAINADNLFVVARELKSSLQWDTAPASRKPEEIPLFGKKNHARPEEAKPGVLTKAFELMYDQKAQKILSECRAIVNDFSSYPHSRSFDGRKALQTELDRLLQQTPKPNLAQAEKIKAMLKAKEETL